MLRGVRGGAGLCRQHPAAIVRLLRSPAGHQAAASRWANNSIHCTQRAAHSQAGPAGAIFICLHALMEPLLLAPGQIIVRRALC